MKLKLKRLLALFLAVMALSCLLAVPAAAQNLDPNQNCTVKMTLKYKNDMNSQERRAIN